MNIALTLRAKNFLDGLKKSEKGLNKLNAVAGTVGRTMQYALGGGIIAATAAVGKAAIEFDRAQSKIAALVNDEAGVRKLAESSRELGRSSIFTAAQVAAMQTELAKLGKGSGDIDKLDDVIVKLATALDLDLTEAAKLAVKTMNQFKDTFKDMNIEDATAQIGEQLVTAMTGSSITAEALVQSLKYVGAEANALGFSFAETVAILGMLADNGYEGSRAGTALRKILTELADEGGDVKKSFLQLISSGADFTAFVERVGIRAAGTGKSLDGMADQLAQFTEEVENAEGNLDRFAKVLGEDLTGEFKEMVSTLQDVGIAILDEVREPLLKVIRSFTSWLRTIDEADIRTGLLVIGMLKLGSAIRAIKGAVSVAMTSLGNLAIRMAALNPAGALVTGVVLGMGIIAKSMSDTAAKVDELKDSAVEAQSLLANFGKSEYEIKLADGTFKDYEEFSRLLQEELDEASNSILRTEQSLAKLLAPSQIDNFTKLIRSGKSFKEMFKVFGQNSDNPFGFTEDTFRGIYDGIVALDDLYAIRTKLQKDLFQYDPTSTSLFSGNEVETPDVNEPTKVLKNYLALWEKVNGAPKQGDTMTESFLNLKRAAAAVGEEIDGIELLITKMNAEGRKVPEATLENLTGLKEVQRYYDLQATAINEVLDKEDARTQFLEKRVGLEAIAYGWAQKRREEAERQAELDRQAMPVYEQLTQKMKEQVDALRMKTDGYIALGDAIQQVFERYQLLSTVVLGTIESIGDAFARALVDPSLTAAEAMRNWGRNALASIAAMMVKLAALATLIVTLNLITGGTFGDVVSLLANGPLGGSPMMQIADQIGMFNWGSGSRSMPTVDVGVRGILSGGDIVFATDRGITANHRLYG